MSWRKVFHTDEESLKYMFSKEIESDVITLPPDVDELTDEKYFDDDEMTIPSVKDLSGNVKICITMEGIEFTCRNCEGGYRGRVAIYRPFGEVSLSLNRTVTCMMLKANDRRTSCPCHDEFRGPRSNYVRQVALATTTTTNMSPDSYWRAIQNFCSSGGNETPDIINLTLLKGTVTEVVD
ncbi:uncharacterized protein TNCV_1563381 [Trichonephila clavipes]|nr:uncharacterized protein TNCV_1563381 [Trichonephila clavipes]